MNAIKKLLDTPDLTYQIGSKTGDVVDTWPVTIQTTAGELRAARAEYKKVRTALERALTEMLIVISVIDDANFFTKGSIPETVYVKQSVVDELSDVSKELE